MSKRYFPCWVCKANGTLWDDVDDWGYRIGEVECGYCEGEGMIEINGEVHTRRKIEKAGLALINEDREYSWEEIKDMGKKALGL